MKKNNNKTLLDLYDEPFTVLGLSSSLPGFKVASKMNHNLFVDFLRLQDFLSYKEESNKEYPFQWFYYYDDIDELCYFLLSNITDNILLIKELKKIDYVLLIIGRDCIEKSKEINKEINKIDGIMFSKVFYNSIPQKEESIKTKKKTFLDSLREDIEVNVPILKEFEQI
jgi:hypothetical protein